MFRILYSLYGIVHAMACLPPAVGAHPSGRIGEDPSGIPNHLFPIVSQVVLPFLAVRVGFTQASELLLPATLVFAVAAVLAAGGSATRGGGFRPELDLLITRLHKRSFPLSCQASQPEQTAQPPAANKALRPPSPARAAASEH